MSPYFKKRSENLVQSLIDSLESISLAALSKRGLWLVNVTGYNKTHLEYFTECDFNTSKYVSLKYASIEHYDIKRIIIQMKSMVTNYNLTDSSRKLVSRYLEVIELYANQK